MEIDNKYKDWMLVLAKEEVMVDFKNMDKVSENLFRCIFEAVKDDGYVVNAWNVAGSITPKLTSQGVYFYLDGGYTKENLKMRREDAGRFLKSLFKSAVDAGVAAVIGRLLP